MESTDLKDFYNSADSFSDLQEGIWAQVRKFCASPEFEVAVRINQAAAREGKRSVVSFTTKGWEVTALRSGMNIPNGMPGGITMPLPLRGLKWRAAPRAVYENTEFPPKSLQSQFLAEVAVVLGVGR